MTLKEIQVIQQEYLSIHKLHGRAFMNYVRKYGRLGAGALKRFRSANGSSLEDYEAIAVDLSRIMGLFKREPTWLVKGGQWTKLTPLQSEAVNEITTLSPDKY
jgi:hypothetical protein